MYCMNNVHILSFTCVCTVWTGKLILISYSSPLATAATFYNVNTIAWAAAIIITWPESHKALGHNRVCNGHNWWVWGIMQKMWLHIHQVWAVLLIKTSQDLHVHLVSVLLLCTNQCWLPWEQGSMYIHILHNRLVLHSNAVHYNTCTVDSQSMHPQPDSTHALNQTWGDVYAENLHFTYAERINSSPIFTVQLSNTHFTTRADAWE